MGRFEESFGERSEEAIKLGEANATCIVEMHHWCKHFRVEMKSAGLFAQMSGLPIGLHAIDCPYSKGGLQSANLPWICSDFLVQECASCPHHSPNGDDSWGREIIKTHEDRERARAEETTRRDAEILRLRSELRDRSQSIGESAGPESRKLIEFFEGLFSDDRQIRQEAAAKLKQAAQVGADLFPDQAIELLLFLTLKDDFDESALEICAELTGKRAEFTSRFEHAALDVIRGGRLLHKAATIVDKLGENARYPLEPECIERLMLSQYHDVPIGASWGWQTDYTSSTAILVRSFEADERSLLNVVRQHLQNEDNHLRVRLCGALMLIQQSRPAIVNSILSELMKSLERYEDRNLSGETPSGQIVHIFQAAFQVEPKAIDAFLSGQMDRVRPTVQEDVVKIYRDQFLHREWNWRERRDRRNTDDVSEAEQVAIRRLLDWMKNDRLEPEIRHKVVGALELACTYATSEMVNEFDGLLGYYAIICDQDGPPPAAPRIIMPGDEENTAVIQLTEANRNQHWGFFKSRLVGCLEKLCEARPQEVFDSVYGCLNHPSAQLGDEFRGAVVLLLGKLGDHFELQHRALPLMMRALMNYDSGWVRAKAIDATVEMFRSHKNAPPTNVVDTILVHLRDPVIVVHQAAVRAVDRRSAWFTGSQTLEAMDYLAVLVHTYRTDPFELEHICAAALGLAGRQKRLKKYAIAIVGSVFPMGNEHVDEKIADKMQRITEPNDDVAPRVARHLATFLAIHERDRFNSFEFSERGRMFMWLHELPRSAFASVATELLEQAKRLAARDFWECWHFASLFCRFGMHSYEREVLAVARDSLAAEPRSDETRTKVSAAIALISATESLQRGDDGSASAYFDEAKGGMK